MSTKLQKLLSLQTKVSSFFSLSQWNTWGFPGCWSGFSSSQMVENTVFGRKWMIENKSLLVLNNCSFFRGLILAVPQVIGYSSRMLPCCAVLCSVGWGGVGYDEMDWSGFSHPGALDAVCPSVPSDDSCFLLLTAVRGQPVMSSYMSRGKLSHCLSELSFILPCFDPLMRHC